MLCIIEDIFGELISEIKNIKVNMKMLIKV